MWSFLYRNRYINGISEKKYLELTYSVTTWYICYIFSLQISIIMTRDAWNLTAVVLFGIIHYLHGHWIELLNSHFHRIFFLFSLKNWILMWCSHQNLCSSKKVSQIKHFGEFELFEISGCLKFIVSYFANSVRRNCLQGDNCEGAANLCFGVSRPMPIWNSHSNLIESGPRHIFL